MQQQQQPPPASASGRDRPRWLRHKNAATCRKRAARVSEEASQDSAAWQLLPLLQALVARDASCAVERASPTEGAEEAQCQHRPVAWRVPLAMRCTRARHALWTFLYATTDVDKNYNAAGTPLLPSPGVSRAPPLPAPPRRRCAPPPAATVRAPRQRPAAVMPRAFLVTARRYSSGAPTPAPATDLPQHRESSPERRVSLAEAQPAAESASASAPVSVAPPQPQPLAVCLPLPEPAPDDLYNLTQLAEVSLAAAAGRLFCWTDADDRPHTVGHGLPPAPADRAAAAATGEPCVPAQPTPTPETAAQPHQPPELAFVRAEGPVPQVPPPPPPQSPAPAQAQHACPDCGKRYSTASNLARHRQTHRGPADAKARRCAHCGKVYVSVPAFSMHVRTHAQACRCPYCGKCFSRPWLLQGHIRTHTGEKPFKCTICEKAFADKSNLRAHVQTHSSTKPHVCCRCGKAFALKSYLYKHEESSCVRLHSRAPQCAGVVGAA
ncbi:transcriptional repressor scratch 1-like [Schistocerca cancellata]|uniref:transcriptional repressor scratch 1-like n=1 Tax=Schistocerca cancellata TaxID=274614 RepID=UPI002117B235|nr:transcriptional repressor scratch 1-like [Schistocerca cancellata]